MNKGDTTQATQDAGPSTGTKGAGAELSIDKLQADLKSVKGAFSKIKRNFEIIQKDFEGVKGQTLHSIEALGIFVALFTFISVDIQIFKSELSLSAATGLVLIILGALLLFIVCLHILLYQNYKQVQVLILGLVSLGLLGFGTFFIANYSKPKENYYTKEEVNVEIKGNIVKSETLLQEFKNCLKSGGWNRCF